ncbi:hypothetical protein GEMRC1_009018 [Eukaryota sp. GEM-RC1]
MSTLLHILLFLLLALYTSADVTTFDFRSEHDNCVPPIKDQGSCAAGYAFSSTYAISARQCLLTSELSDPSEQELISCLHGCDTGHLSDVSSYVADNGLRSSSCFTYHERDTSCIPRCSSSVIGFIPVVWVNATSYVFDASLSFIKQQVVDHGPITITIPIYESWISYTGGIYDAHINDTSLGYHHVNIIGFDDSENSFLLTNSFGTDWGENGYWKGNQSSEMFPWGLAVMGFHPTPEELPFDWTLYVIIGGIVVILLLVLGCFYCFKLSRKY